MTRHYISLALAAAAFLTSGDELWQIGLTAALIVAALAVQGVGRRKIVRELIREICNRRILKCTKKSV